MFLKENKKESRAVPIPCLKSLPTLVSLIRSCVCLLLHLLHNLGKSAQEGYVYTPFCFASPNCFHVSWNNFLQKISLSFVTFSVTLPFVSFFFLPSFDKWVSLFCFLQSLLEFGLCSWLLLQKTCKEEDLTLNASHWPCLFR